MRLLCLTINQKRDDSDPIKRFTRLSSGAKLNRALRCARMTHDLRSFYNERLIIKDTPASEYHEAIIVRRYTRRGVIMAFDGGCPRRGAASWQLYFRYLCVCFMCIRVYFRTLRRNGVTMLYLANTARSHHHYLSTLHFLSGIFDTRL